MAGWSYAAQTRPGTSKGEAEIPKLFAARNGVEPVGDATLKPLGNFDLRDFVAHLLNALGFHCARIRARGVLARETDCLV